MKFNKTFFLFSLFIILIFTYDVKSQIIDSVGNQDKIKSSPVPVPQDQQQQTANPPAVQNNVDNRLTGEWWTDSKDAPFAKIVFGADGSFVAYTLKTDSRPYVTGMYSINNGSININYSNITSTGEVNNMPATYTYKSYSVSGSKIQLLSEDGNAYNYYLSANNQKQK